MTFQLLVFQPLQNADVCVLRFVFGDFLLPLIGLNPGQTNVGLLC